MPACAIPEPAIAAGCTEEDIAFLGRVTFQTAAAVRADLPAAVAKAQEALWSVARAPEHIEHLRSIMVRTGTGEPERPLRRRAARAEDATIARGIRIDGVSRLGLDQDGA